MKKIYKKPVTHLHLTASGKDIMQELPSLEPHSNDFGDVKTRDDDEFDKEFEMYMMEHSEEFKIENSLW